MTAGTIAHHLRGRKQQGGYMACCPAHKDRTPSLSLKDSGDGKVLVHCHAGCEQSAVVDALKSKGLWPERETKNQDHRIITAAYDYTDAAGNLLYQVVRFEPKHFLPRYPNGRGGWIWRKHAAQVLYHLPEVLEASIVFIVEGEKDVETLRSHGFVATTNAGGADAPWLPRFTMALRGREIIIVPDNDKPGKRRALRIARALLHVAAKLTILELEGAKDITEWFASGHSELELIAQLDGERVSK